ncbi:Acg family FMN-binding oxidoreductase [uncultured Sphingomonas sp.]|uniref:Acg family FMN-binding oxidoreductase n=1 Tax=uncultured Sphingomonas sp. TaxID=158754 RepID=UPI0035CBD426
MRDFVRYATLAANGHNTQPWRFALTEGGVTIGSDFARRTPVVDPDDHHLFVSLGCAAENLSIAASANGHPAAIAFDAANSRIAVDLAVGRAADVDLCRAIPARQSTRSLLDGRTIAADDLKRLERAAAIDGVSLLLILDRPRREGVLEHLIAANDRQMDDPAFVDELRHWVRFNADEAMRRGDGLYSGCTGSRTVPSWLGRRLFPLLFTKQAEDARYTAQLRSSSGIAVFVGDKADAEHWVRVGRSFQRFALQATALGLRHAHVNQPIEVPAVRAAFARWLGIGDARPDLVVRFGAAPALPMAMRRVPVIA